MNTKFSDYLLEVSYSYVRQFELRYGQTCFNVLYLLDPDLADSIRGTDLDPFHNDNRVPEFLKRLRDEWGNDV